MRQIIFDLDETLYSGKELREKREKVILEFLGERKQEYHKLRENYGTIKSFELMGFSREDFFNVINKVPIMLERDLDLIEIIKKLKNNFKIIVLSNSPKHCVKQTLESIGILDLVDKYYSGEDFKESKPSKECFFMIQENDICIGNNFKKDLEVPKQLGAIIVLIGNSEYDADFKINNIHELKDIIDKFIN